MEVTVFSLLEGSASGYIVFKVPSTYVIGDLLHHYCLEKGIEVASDYVLCDKSNATLNPLKTLEEEGIKNADTVKLTQEDKNEQLYAFGSWWVIAVLALVIGCVGFLYCLYMFYFPEKLPQKYGLIIDAGSTHSKLFVFTWSKPDRKTNADIELIHNCIMSGGVADYRFHTDDLHHYFTTCINEAEDMIPLSIRPHTPLILAATAGMRMLRAYDPEGASLILSSIREVFWSKTDFHIKHKDVFVASGQQEGINGWAALNYLLENFEEADSQASALDLGGASVQVTTELSKEVNHWPAVNITIFNNTYRIFSKSFLCYGIEEAKHRYQYLLVSELVNKTSNVIQSPCLPKGFEISLTSEDFYNPCIFSEESRVMPSLSTSRKYPTKYAKKYISGFVSHVKDNQSDSQVSIKKDKIAYLLQGTSNTQFCKQKVESLFDYELCKSNFVLGDCLDKNMIPPYKGELVGFSEIFHKLFPRLGVNQEGNLEDFQNVVLDTCSLSNEELLSSHPNVSKEQIEDLCFDGMYVYALLKEVLGITSQRWKNILFTNKVHEQDVVWAMGLMLNRTSHLSYSEGSRMDLVTFSILLILFSLFVIMSLLFAWYALKLKQRGNIYQRVYTDALNP